MGESAFDVIVNELKNARHVVAMTGAGVSAESGIPTFRDALEGYWSRYDAEELATPQAFARDPALVTRWYDERRMTVNACEPNPGHYALARIEQALHTSGRRFTLITQNVDGLHARSGSTQIVEVHGSLTTWRGVDSGRAFDLPAEAFAEYPPRNDEGELIRPGVVWFGESLPSDAVRLAAEALQSCDVYLAVGTSGLVFPAAGFVYEARASGATTIELNLDSTPMSHEFDLVLRGKSGEILPKLALSALGV